MSRTRANNGRNGSPKQDERPERNGRASPRNKRLTLYVAVVILVCAAIIIAALANSSFKSLDVKKGDILEYTISGYESGKNVTGSLVIEVTGTSYNMFKVMYAVTLDGNTTRTEVTFTGASGDWAANVGNVMGRLSGSTDAPTVGETASNITMYGYKNMTGYIIATTTRTDVDIFYEYWLDTTTSCPYVMAMTYMNGDYLQFYLIYTNISEFT